MSSKLPAILVLADGTKFRGTSIGIKGSVVGEIVFNTAMTGYQEILSDPSYTEQIITFTYPHIGNRSAGFWRKSFNKGKEEDDVALEARGSRSV